MSKHEAAYKEFLTREEVVKKTLDHALKECMAAEESWSRCDALISANPERFSNILQEDYVGQVSEDDEVDDNGVT